LLNPEKSRVQVIDDDRSKSDSSDLLPVRRPAPGAPPSQRIRTPVATDVLDRLHGRIGHWHLPDNLLDDLFGHHALLTYSRGATIFSQDSPADVVFVIHKGLINLYSYQPDGHRVLIRLAGMGEIIGYANTLDPKGRPFHAVEAIGRTSCQLAIVTREHLGSVLQSLDPRALVKLIERLNAAWSAETLRWAGCVLRDCRQRLQLVFADLAHRFGVRDARGIVLLPELSHQDLAEMTGCSRPMASRVISLMLKQGTLDRQEGHYIVPAGSAIEALLPDHRPPRP